MSISSTFHVDLKLPREPWPHQVEEWQASLADKERLLLWDMGTGKTTTSTVWLRLKYRQKGEVAKTLILAPLATLSGWLADFQRNSPQAVHSRVAILAGVGKKKMSGKKRVENLFKDETRIALTNYESLTMPEFVGALKLWKPEAIVADEIHRIKNPQSKRFKGLLEFSDKAEYRLGLTGTLILNGYMDVWAPMRFLDKGKRFGTNFYSQFRDLYFVDMNAGMRGKQNYFPDWQPKAGLEEIISQKMGSLASRKKKEECLNLPERTQVIIEVPLSADQDRLYNEMLTELVASVEAGDATASNALVKLLRMRQILCGFLPIENLEDPEVKFTKRIADNPRLDFLADLLEDLPPGEKIVVWSTFRANYPVLKALCEKAGRGWAEYTGETKDKDGEKKRFIEDPNCSVMLANPQAGGTGVDGFQQVASYCAYFDRSHNAEHYWQSRDRIHRGGQTKNVTEYHLVAPGTVDEDVFSALIRKENFAENILERVRLMNERRAAMEGKGNRGR